MNALNLTESAWQRAKRDAANAYRTPTFGLALALAELLAVPAAVLTTAGNDDTATQVAVPVLSGAVAIVLAVVVVLAMQLLAAPVRQRDELRRRWSRVEQDVDRPASVELTLRDERRKCDDLLAALSSKVDCSSEDRLAAEEWTSGMIDFLTEHVDADAARQFIEAARNVDGTASQLQARAQVLDRIIKRVRT
jgi:hypothetical protein